MDACPNKACAMGCKLMLVLSALAFLASIVGAYVAHFGMSGSFGTTAASLSLLALPVNLMVCWKLGKAHCAACRAACCGSQGMKK